MIFIEGPRQAGKTTLAKKLMLDYKRHYYLNYDNLRDRETILSGQSFVEKILLENSLGNEQPILVLDEIHKYPEWKNHLKGLYDSYKDQIKIIATGSAKLTLYKKSQDSLMGRYFPYTIYPISVGEIVNAQHDLDELIRLPSKIDDKKFQNLYNYGGFPDPYFRADNRFHQRWQKLRFEQLFRDDILKIGDVKHISQLELFANILTCEAGQQINYSSLAKKVQAADQTIKKWLNMLESFYFGFCIKPWHHNIVKSIIKEPKFYLWDWSYNNDVGTRAENFIACHLKKATKYWTDCGIGDFDLFYLRTTDQKEVDFIVTKDNKPWFLVEVKYSMESSLNKNLFFFQENTGALHAFQVVINAEYVNIDCFTQNEPIKVPAKTFLSQLA